MIPDDNDQQLVQRWFLRSVLSGHPYGRSVVGTQKTLAAITLADVRECYRRHFTRDNLLFSFAGAVEITNDFHTDTVQAGAPVGVCVPSLALASPAP